MISVEGMVVSCLGEVDLFMYFVLSSRIAVEVINHLIEIKRLNPLREAMNAFVDVPETSMVDVLICYLTCQNADFEGLCETPYLQMEFIPQEEDGDSKYLLCVA